jgi:signal transduction histidine kinase
MLVHLISGRGSPDTAGMQRTLMGLDHYVVLQHLPARPSDRHFDAVLVDMRTGVGLEDLAGVREANPDVPMFVVADTVVPTPEQVESLQLVTVLLAPVDVRALDTALRSVEVVARRTVVRAVPRDLAVEEEEDEMALPAVVGMNRRPVVAARPRLAGGFLSYSEVVGTSRPPPPRLDPFSTLLEKLVTSSGPESLQTTTDWLCEWLGAGACVLAQLADEGGFNVLARTDPGALIWDRPFPREGALWDRCLRDDLAYERQEAGRTLSELAPLGVEGFVAVPIRDLHGRPSGILCAVSAKRLDLPPRAAHVLGILAARADRTLAQARTESALARARNDAKLAARQKTGWLASMVHELRSPVSSILASSELLEQGRGGPLTDDQRRHVGAAVENSRQVLELVNEVLDIAKIDSGKAELYPEQTNVAELISSALRRLQPLADEKHTSITVFADQDLPAVYIDPKRLAQVMRTVLSYAIELAGQGGRVTARAQVDEAWLVVTVATGGAGIAPEDVPHVFRELATLHDATGRTLAQGTGLGLALAKRIVELCGGFIGVASVPDDGATFSVRIPVRSADEAAP